MVDIATIGFASDTSGLVKAEGALNRLTPAAQKAEVAAANVAGALGAASQQANKVTLAAGGLTVANTNLERSKKVVNLAYERGRRLTDEYFKSLEKARRSTQGLSADAKNLSFQLIDVTQGLAGGQPIYQVFAQQSGQIAQLMASPGGLTALFKELSKAIFAVLTPLRLLTIGFLGAAAGILIYANNVISSSKAMDELSKQTDMSVTRLRQLEQLTSAKGINSEDFAAGMRGFSEQVYQAQRNMGELNGLMLANGKTAKTNEQYFAAIADLVARTTSEVQKRKILEAAGLPTTKAWVDLMSQGSKAIEAAANGTVKFNESAEANLVRKAKQFDDAWNKATTNISNYLKSGIISVMNQIANFQPPAWMAAATKASLGLIPFIGAAQIAAKVANNQAAGSFDDRFQQSNAPGNSALLEAALNKRAGQLRGPDPKTQQELLQANQLAQQRIGILGDLATVEDRVKQKQLELNAAGLQGVGVTKQQAAAILNATRAQEEMNRVNQQAQIGIFNVAQANKAAADTLQMWIDKGLVDKTNTEQMAAAKLVLARNIDQVKQSAQLAAAPLQGLKQLELDASNFGKQLDTTLVSSLNNLVTPIQDVLNGVTSLSDGFKNGAVIILKAIQEMIIKMLILAPIAKALQASLGGFAGGGVFGGDAAGALASGVAPLAKGAAFANGGAFTNKVVNRSTLFSFANGTKLGEMGEAGPEAIMPLKRGPNGSLGVQMYGGRRGGDTPMQFNYSPSYALGGNATQDDIAMLRKEQARDRQRFQAETARAISDMRKRNGSI